METSRIESWYCSQKKDSKVHLVCAFMRLFSLHKWDKMMNRKSLKNNSQSEMKSESEVIKWDDQRKRYPYPVQIEARREQRSWWSRFIWSDRGSVTHGHAGSLRRHSDKEEWGDREFNVFQIQWFTHQRIYNLLEPTQVRQILISFEDIYRFCRPKFVLSDFLSKTIRPRSSRLKNWGDRWIWTI
jgi:hypothetical protein